MNASETIVLLLLLLLLFLLYSYILLGRMCAEFDTVCVELFPLFLENYEWKGAFGLNGIGGDSCGGICLYFRVNNNTNFYKLDKKPRPILPPNYLLRAKSLTKEHLDRRLKFFVSRTFSKRSQAVTVLLWFSLPGLLPFVTLLFRGGRRIPLYYCPPRFLA